MSTAFSKGKETESHTNAAEVEKLHAKMANWLWSGVLCQALTRPTGATVAASISEASVLTVFQQHGSQFTSSDWIQTLTDAEVNVSIDGRERWVDNQVIERLWRSIKYECIYLNAFEARAGIGKWIAYYNAERPHSSYGILTPNMADNTTLTIEKIDA